MSTLVVQSLVAEGDEHYSKKQEEKSIICTRKNTPGISGTLINNKDALKP